jgi:hypothetical protein
MQNNGEAGPCVGPRLARRFVRPMTPSARPWCLVALLTVACASTVDGDLSLDAGRDASRNDRPGVSRDVPDARVDVPFFDTAVYDVFRDPPCPSPRPAPRRDYVCDPVRGTGCEVGEGCYAFIEYPSVRCGVETYRSVCAPAGTTPAGEFCRSGNECRSGFGCFVTGAMNRCLRLCRLDGTGTPCDRGQVCEPTDLPDFGACH